MKKYLATLIILMGISTLAFGTEEFPRLCDLDEDGDVDRYDVRIILGARGTYADGPNDPYDINGDGVISVNDARACVLLCDRPRCAVE